MAVSAEFLEYVLDQLELLGGVTSRRLFGGAALYQHGLIFGLVSGEAVYFRTDGSNLADYEAAGSERFDPMPDRPAKFGYFSVPPDILEQPGLGQAAAPVPIVTPGGGTESSGTKKSGISGRLGSTR
jgi:DNA transformation protein